MSLAALNSGQMKLFLEALGSIQGLKGLRIKDEREPLHSSTSPVMNGTEISYLLEHAKSLTHFEATYLGLACFQDDHSLAFCMKDHPALETIQVFYPHVDYDTVSLDVYLAAWATIPTLVSVELAVGDSSNTSTFYRLKADKTLMARLFRSLKSLTFRNCDFCDIRGIVHGIQDEMSRLEELYLEDCLFYGDEQESQDLSTALRDSTTLRVVSINLSISPFSRNYSSVDEGAFAYVSAEASNADRIAEHRM